ncbi:poly [ADP-ribose] polymerase 4-like [Lingula anatina]|uniref:Poly [ADP-ribose] polymerase 4-like n=1 Tax=Lingula anatina TaxID=7574 RepID=A0A1S3IPJ6_LINAN|nr:poly [ADP-ribose] polymerase 4-like [Lingula anatina]|eukprot:XP_013399831.1 poly [ADP-ribose] polymerase 4-like [Lingula anatina]
MAVVEMTAGQALGDGFQLLIGLAEIHVPRMWVEEDVDNPGSPACMLTFYPEFEAESDLACEVILLIDVSNSMKEKALQDAKKVALLTLHHLSNGCVFNVVSFGTGFEELFPCSMGKTKLTVKQAQEFIQALQPSGGNTEVIQPLQVNFLLKPSQGLRNIFLISDGHVNNEEAVFTALRKNYEHTRLFTLGVSATANKYLLRSLARVGAGAYEYFDNKTKSKWEKKVKCQLDKVSQPGLTSVSVAWQQYDDDLPPPVQAPTQITSLFNGSRQVVYGFVPNCMQATLKAMIAGFEVSTVVSTSDLSITKGKILHRLTAKAILRDWEEGSLDDDRTQHEVLKMNRKNLIIQLSTKYSIVTQFTSFIAIEKREKDEDMSSEGPRIEAILAEEDVDILPYIGWKEKEEILNKQEEKRLIFHLTCKVL